MIYVLLIFQAVLVFGIVLFTLSFLIASLKENEHRAALMAAALSGLLIGMELCIYFLYTLGFFFHIAGMLVLVGAWVATGAAIYFLCRRTGPNQRTLKGVDGYIVGQAQRFDEREQVFARERTMRPDSAQYKEFYRTHPELEQMDSERRKAGGLLGTPGTIDRPGGTSNVSAMTAAFAIPPHLGKPESHSPTAHATGENRSAMSPAEATLRVKGFARHLGAGVVGVAKINPLWVSVSRIFAAFAKNACTAALPVLFPMEIDMRSRALRDGS
jgi:hypothetical protein